MEEEIGRGGNWKRRKSEEEEIGGNWRRKRRKRRRKRRRLEEEEEIGGRVGDWRKSRRRLENIMLLVIYLNLTKAKGLSLNANEHQVGLGVNAAPGNGFVDVA